MPVPFCAKKSDVCPSSIVCEETPSLQVRFVMDKHPMNPYQSPKSSSVESGHAKFRLKRWFALSLYLGLFCDFAVLMAFGFQPLIISVMIFTVCLIASVTLRRRAHIKFDKAGIRYSDFVQVIDISWDRIALVIHHRSKSCVITNSPLSRISLIRKHASYESLLMHLSTAQADHDFECRDWRG